MHILYDKDGKEIKARHSVDKKEILASGEYFEEKPKAKRGVSAKKEPVNTDTEGE